MGKKNLPFRGGLCLRAGQAGRASPSSFSSAPGENFSRSFLSAIVALMLDRRAALMVPLVRPDPRAQLAMALVRSPRQLSGDIMIPAAQLDSNTAFLTVLYGIGMQHTLRGLYEKAVIGLSQPGIPVLIEVGLSMQGTEVLSHIDVVEDAPLAASHHGWKSWPKEEPTAPAGEDDPLARGQLCNLLSSQRNHISHDFSPPLSQ